MAVADFERELKKELPNYRIITWRESKKEWLEVLGTEKTMMTFLLGFVILVAAFSITNTLITKTIEKTREIGLLKALGITNSSIRNIFIFQGVIIGVIGSVTGVGLGLFIITFRNKIIFFICSVLAKIGIAADYYFLNNLPAITLNRDLIFISFMAVFLSMLGALIPAIRASRLEAAKALRYE
jgi:lipoprotein-releasing system permease protein